MSQAERPVDPIEPAAADDKPDIAALLATIEAYRRDNEALRAAAAERAARDAPIWLPLKRAAGNVPMPYENARAWAKRAIADGRLNEARKPAGRVVVNLVALTAHHRITAK